MSDDTPTPTATPSPSPIPSPSPTPLPAPSPTPMATPAPYISPTPALPDGIDDYTSLLGETDTGAADYGTGAPGPDAPVASSTSAPVRAKVGTAGSHDGAHYVVYEAEVRAKGDRSWRTNNPGSLDYHGQPGSIGTDGRLAIFPDYEAGHAALLSLLEHNYATLTIRNAMYKYAPPEENQTEEYIRYIEAKIGLPHGGGTKATVGEHLDAVADAIEHFEGGHAGDIYTCGSGPAWAQDLLGCSHSAP